MITDVFHGRDAPKPGDRFDLARDRRARCLTQSNTRMVGSWTDRATHLRAEVQRLAQLVGRFRCRSPKRRARASS
jgi:hypothetical protein